MKNSKRSCLKSPGRPFNGHRVKGKVYITQDDGTKNFYPATHFGELSVFSRFDAPTLYVGDFIEDFEDWLATFNPDADYLLLSGDPIFIALAGAVLSYLPAIPVLKWDRQEKVYLPVLVKTRS